MQSMLCKLTGPLISEPQNADHGEGKHESDKVELIPNRRATVRRSETANKKPTIGN